VRFRGPLALGALLAVPASLSGRSDLAYVIVISGFFALVLVGLFAQIRAGILGLRSGAPARAVAGTTVAYWGAAAVVLALAPSTLMPDSDLVPLLISAAVTGTLVIAVTSVVRALGSRSAARRAPSGRTSRQAA
jgi:uncharacterized integral membrane protein